ncbi:MAG: type IV pilin protein [Candidatus Microsaccharimonas sp.]
MQAWESYIKTGQQKARSTGFTIVELLIVIVVIAILAAITIVSFSGIQNSAHDSAVQSDLKQLATKVEMFRVKEGRLPRGAELTTLGLKVSKNSYTDTLLISGSINYNVIYCSPINQEARYTFAAQSKSGKVFRYGTAGTGEMTSSNSASSVTLCTDAGVATNDATSNSRMFLYSNGWETWVQG